MFQPSQYAGLSVDEIVRKHTSELMRARVITILISLVCVVMWFVSTDTLPGTSLFAVFLILMAFIVVAPLVFMWYMSKHFFELRSILLQDCDAEKYRAVLEGVVPRGWLNGKRRPVFICEFALTCYYLGECEQALELLSHMRAPSRKRMLNLQAAQVDVYSRCYLGDKSGAEAAYQRSLTLLETTRSNGKNRQLLADIRENLEFVLSDSAAWGDGELAAIERRTARAETRMEWASWQFKHAKWKLVHGDAPAARAMLEPLAEGPLVPIMKHELEKLRAEAGVA